MSSGECPQIASARGSEDQLAPWSRPLKVAQRTSSGSRQLLAHNDQNNCFHP